jgi:hypothetical protein
MSSFICELTSTLPCCRGWDYFLYKIFRVSFEHIGCHLASKGQHSSCFGGIATMSHSIVQTTPKKRHAKIQSQSHLTHYVLDARLDTVPISYEQSDCKSHRNLNLLTFSRCVESGLASRPQSCLRYLTLLDLHFSSHLLYILSSPTIQVNPHFLQNLLSIIVENLITS